VLRIGYSCHSTFPSTHTNTQQIFWTLCEVARLGVRLNLSVRALAASSRGESASETIASYYGARGEAVPANLSIASANRRPEGGWVDEALFDVGAGSRLGAESWDLVWTRDYVAAAACIRARLPTVFETYRLDLARDARFALWRRLVLGSRHLRGLVAHSNLTARGFVDSGLQKERCLVAHNGFAPRLMEPRLDRDTARKRLRLPTDRSLVVYAGHAGPHKGTDTLISMAAAVPDASFLIVGVDPESVEARRIGRLAAAVSANNVMLRPRVPIRDVAAYLYAADCLVIPPSDRPLGRFRRTVLPMKTFSYLAAGRAILAPRLPDLEEVLTDGVTARLVSPTDVAASARALRQLLADDGLRERLASGALAASAPYTWETRARRITKFFDQIRD
jgi:glycosyltransferase involved in cell wall biosynthesis